MKKLLTILLTLTCVTSTIFAHDCVVDGIYYNLNKKSKTASVTYKGANPTKNTNRYVDAVTIPQSISVEEQTYSVTSIGNYAFEGCSGMTSITIPNSITSIGEGGFIRCSSLRSITIPNSVSSIGEWAFSSCSGLRSITIPNSVSSIGEWAFYNCGLNSVTMLNPNVKVSSKVFKSATITDLYCGSSVDLSKAEGTIKNVYRLSIEEFASNIPFDQYAKGFVESQINEWQKKGEFEKTSDWQARVTEASRKQKIDALVRDAKKNYLAHYQKHNGPTFTLETYDADNEVYLVQSSSGQDLLVAVPFAEASYVKQNWASSKASPKYDIQGTKVVITSVGFTFPNKKTYTYEPNQKLTYATADLNYNFEPIELPEMQIVTMGGSGVAQIPQGINSISIATPFDINPASSVLASYKNIFGKYEMPEKDETFPYVVVRVILSGNPQLISLAKQSLALDLGQSYIVEQTVPQEDKILFLVPTGVKNIYLTSGNGLRQLIYSGRLQANKIYDGVVEVR